MPTEHALLIVRRRPQGPSELNVTAEAVRVLVRDGLVLEEIEHEAQRKLTAEEVRAYHAERASIEAAIDLT